MRNLLKTLEKYSDDKVKALIKFLISKDKSATGKLINSIDSILNIDGDNGTIEFNVDGEFYYKFIESGRKPISKLPPKKPIQDWLTARNIDPKLEYIIRRSIAKKGIKPLKITEEIFSNTELEKLEKEIEKAYQKDLNELLEKAIKKIRK